MAALRDDRRRTRRIHSDLAENQFWNVPLDALVAELGSGSGGLTEDQAERRLAEYGPNEALAPHRAALWRQIGARLANPLILVLLFASALSAWTGQTASFSIIVVIILMNVVLDVAQQRRAESTVDALRRSVGIRTQVVRDGQERTIAVEQLVPGDVVCLPP